MVSIKFMDESEDCHAPIKKDTRTMAAGGDTQDDRSHSYDRQELDPRADKVELRDVKIGVVHNQCSFRIIVTEKR